ncbi:recombinase family protein [Novipirellula sp. SH528]|uniref:recombinase family protein n=1 Tax=Novipirellula sp. SH528 TaxID=3454466 RepID=UPI003F9ED9CC
MIASTKQPKNIRCAIYTRKSTTEGLDQDFNTLDAQRESGAAYIASQRGEGWTEVETLYDDGGFTGGNMERPALKRLLSDIEAGLIDCVVVYKVDRLSRSLLDFSRIMNTLDVAGCSFVSVTQQFNTCSSMGRLTLNILLSFAQFEREIIGERTRDKMGAARRKGKYIGGRPVLGYDINRETKRLVVNESEAVRVRQIFDLYLEHGGLLTTIDAIEQRGFRTKLWTTKAGKTVGGVRFNKNTLHALLTNRIYLGKVTYHDQVYEGEHDAIVDSNTYDLVQKKLRANRVSAGDRVHGRSPGVLAGLIHCTACGCMMTHASSGARTKSKRYRYYVCSKATKRGRKTCPRPSLPAEEVERFIVAQLQSLTIDEKILNAICNRVRRSIDERRSEFIKEQTALATAIHRTERSIDSLSVPTSDAARETIRLDSLASLNEQHHRDRMRLCTLHEQLATINSATPDRVSILRAIDDLETLWDHMTLSERSRLMSLLIERIDHDPTDSNLSITLSPTGLESLDTITPTSETQTQ